MLNLFTEELGRMRHVAPALGPVPMGRIVSCDGGMIEVSGLDAPIGTLCRAEAEAGEEAPSAEARAHPV